MNGIHLLGRVPDAKEKKEIMVKRLLEEKIQVKGDEEGIDILNACLELINDYNTKGYRHFKRCYDEGTYYKKGHLFKGNNIVGRCVGEVTDYVSPSLEIEGMIDNYIKAIAIVEIWQTEDAFIFDWEENVFGGARDLSEKRFIFMGWVLNRYIGWNTNSVKIQHDCGKVDWFLQFDRRRLSIFWNKAWNTVKAMLIVDCLDSWACDYFISPVLTPAFHFGLFDE
jgi:hypothetical protein